MSPFSRQSGHIRKNICYVPCKYHNRTFLPPLRLYVPFGCFRRTFLSSFCLYVPCSCHSRTFLPFSRLYVPLLYAPGYFSTFILYMSRLILSAGFYAEQKCFAGEICISVCFNNQNPGNTQVNVLPPPSSFVFGIIRNLFSGRIHMIIFLHDQLRDGHNLVTLFL